MDKKEYAAELLAQGIQAVQVAKTVGVTDSMITQWQQEDEFQEMVSTQMAGYTEAQIQFDDKLDKAELLALENLERRLPMANLQQSLMAFKVLNSANRKKHQGQNMTQQSQAPLVQIIAPVSIVSNYVRNSQSEIVEVDGKTMVSASPQQLQQLVQQRLGRTLPTPEQSRGKNDRADNILQSVIAPSARKRVTVLKDITADQL